VTSADNDHTKKKSMKKKLHALLACTLLAACTGVDEQVDTDSSSELSKYDLARGGRLFDKWYADSSFHATFSPGSKGGPFGDGELADVDGTPFPNTTGHNYRLKSFFGWDLRGTAGIYGSDYADKSYALPIDLLAQPHSHAELAAWFESGGDGLPAYGDVLSSDQIDDMAAFVVAMRTGLLPRASDIWALSDTAPGRYTLLPGGDLEAGHEAYASTCAACHGVDGTHELIDGGEYTLGTFVRQKAYEAWFKVLVGHPGSKMASQVPEGLSAKEQAAWILNVFAALCDRDAYPATGASEEDVEDGDPRCGEYLR
jgi:mono/diheme cytochrome c family protein